MGLKPGQTTPTSFSKDKPRPGPGRRKMTEEEKWKARILNAEKVDFKERCRALLPIATDQLAKRIEKGKMKDGDVLRATEVLRDSVHGKPAQAITGAGGGPLAFSFSQLVAHIDGAKVEKI